MSQVLQSPSLEFVEGVGQSIHGLLESLFQQEERLESHFAEHGGSRSVAVQQFEENLAAWQSILADMADRVRLAQDELDTLDRDLNQALHTFTTARKHLQGD